MEHPLGDLAVTGVAGTAHEQVGGTVGRLGDAQRVEVVGLEALEEPVARRQRAVVGALGHRLHGSDRSSAREQLPDALVADRSVGAELLGEQGDAVLLEHPARPPQRVARRTALPGSAATWWR